MQGSTHIVYALLAGRPVGQGEYRMDRDYLPELTRHLTRRARADLLGREERMTELDRNGKPIRMAR